MIVLIAILNRNVTEPHKTIYNYAQTSYTQKRTHRTMAAKTLLTRLTAGKYCSHPFAYPIQPAAAFACCPEHTAVGVVAYVLPTLRKPYIPQSIIAYPMFRTFSRTGNRRIILQDVYNHCPLTCYNKSMSTTTTGRLVRVQNFTGFPKRWRQNRNKVLFFEFRVPCWFNL